MKMAPRPMETKEGRPKMTKEKVIQRSRVSRPGRSLRSSTANSKKTKRRRERTHQEKPSHQRGASGNHQRQHFHDQGHGRPVHLKARTNSSKQSVPASTICLDHGLIDSGRRASTASSDRNQSKSGRDIQSLKGLDHPGGSHKAWNHPFGKDPESSSAERTRRCQWEQYDRERYGRDRPMFQGSGIKSRTNSRYFNKKRLYGVGGRR